MENKINRISSVAIVGLLIFSGCLGFGDDGVIGNNLNPQAVVSISSDQKVVDLGEPVTFDASTSSDEDGSVSSYSWDFGDGTKSNTMVASHKFLNPGEYIISLSVTDDKGAVGNNDKKLSYVTVLHPEVSSTSNLPYALISVKSSVIAAGSEIEFSGAGSWAWSEGSPSTDKITSWDWDFGDGNTATGSIVTHTFGSSGGLSSYSSVGSYPVKLTVQSSGGSLDTVYQTIRVLPVEVSSTGSPNPDVLTSISIGDPVTLDPAEAYDSASGAILTNTYETLVFYDRERTDKLIPILAEEVPTVANGGISQDGLTYTFKIRQGVTFHDKSPMDADDVVFSLNRMLVIDHPEGPARMYTEILDKTDEDGDGIADSIVKIDQYTVQFQLNQSAPRFLPIMAYNGASILSKEWLTSLGCGVPIPGQECVSITDKVMGTGPYMMNEDYGGKWVREQYVLMEYYPSYWRGWSDSQRQSNGVTVSGFIKTVYLKKNNDQPSRVLELLSGKADFAYVDPSYREQVVGQPGIDYDEGLKSLSMGFIGFNHDIQDYEGTAPSSDFFANVDIRKAFCYAFDYNSYVNNILDGYGFQPKGPIPLGLLGHDPEGPSYSYNLEMAESHFREAGVWDSGFTFTAYYNSGNDVRLNALLLLQNALEIMNPNFNMEVQGLEWPDYLDKLKAGELPLFFLGWAPDYADPHNYAHPFLHSDGYYAYYLNFAYDDIDAKIMEAAVEPSESQRVMLYKDLADLEHDKALYIWGSQSIGYHFERDWVNGWYHNMMHGTLYYQLSKD